MIKNTIIAALLFPVVSFAYSCTNVPIEFHDAYAVTTSDDETLGVYLSAVNRDPIGSHTITGVSSPGARSAVFQSYAQNSDDDSITTGVVGDIVIPPKEIFVFRPRHMHIVLSGYKDRPNPDDMISLTFTFADECTETVNNIPVKSPED